MAAKRKYKKRKKTTNNTINIKIIGTIIFSVLLAVLLFTNSGTLGEKINEILGGMMGILRYILPVGMFAIAIKIACNDEDGEYIAHKLTQYAILIICIAIVMSIYQISKGTLEITGDISQILKRAYTLGAADIGGGAIGTLAAVPLVKLLGNLGATVLSIGVSIMLFTFIFGIDISEYISNKMDEWLVKREENKEERENNKKEQQKLAEERRQKRIARRQEIRENREKQREINQIQEIEPEQIKIKLNGRVVEETTKK